MMGPINWNPVHSVRGFQAFVFPSLSWKYGLTGIGMGKANPGPHWFGPECHPSTFPHDRIQAPQLKDQPGRPEGQFFWGPIRDPSLEWVRLLTSGQPVLARWTLNWPSGYRPGLRPGRGPLIIARRTLSC